MTVLGELYRDEFTNFEGRAIGVATYLAGYIAVLLVRRDVNGKPEEVWIPQNRLAPVTVPGGVGFSGPGS